MRLEFIDANEPVRRVPVLACNRIVVVEARAQDHFRFSPKEPL
jgi:hypothetical protein